MSELLARDLLGTPIVGTDGKAFGRLATITMDPESGALRDLVVEPLEGQTSVVSARPGDEDRPRIPIDRIETIEDRIIVRSD